MKAKKNVMVFLPILILAFAIRLITFKEKYLLAYDPYFHYAVSRYIIENGEFPFFWNLANAPTGRYINEPLGLYYIGVFFYKILPFSFFDTFKLTPAIVGTLSLIPFYFLVKEIFNRRVALYSSLILAILPAFVYRGLAGFYRGDVFFIFFMFFAFYFFIKSIKTLKLNYAIISGLFFGFTAYVWNGYIFGYIILAGFILIYSFYSFIKEEELKNMLIFYSISFIIGIGMILLLKQIQPVAGLFIKDLALFVFPSTLALALLFEFSKSRITKKTPFLIVLFALVAIIVLAFTPEIVKKLIGGYGLVRPKTGTLATTAELQPLTIELLWGKFNLLTIAFVVGLVPFLKNFKFEKEKIFLVSWLLASIFILYGGLRYTFIASPAIAVISALVFEFPEIKIEKKYIMIFFSLAIFFSSILCLEYVEGVKPGFNEYWEDAMLWLKDNTPEDSVVLSWWDYGYWIQCMSERRAVIDPAQDLFRIKEVAQMLMSSDEGEVRQILEKYRVDYLLIPTEMIGQMNNINYILGRPEVNYLLFPYEGKTSIDSTPADVYGNVVVYNLEDGDKIITIRVKNKLYAIKNAYWRKNGSLVEREYTESNLPFFDGAIYVGDDIYISRINYSRMCIYIPPSLLKTLLTNALFFDCKDFSHLSLVYKNPEIRIYRVG